MKKATLFILFTSVVLTRCKKEKSESNISYVHLNESVKLSSQKSIKVDVDKNGTIDFQFFLELSSTSKGDHLNVIANPIANNSANSGPANDDNFLNMGQVTDYQYNSQITNTLKANQRWSDDFAYLAIRHTSTSGSVTYAGAWSTGKPTFMAFKLFADGKSYFGWISLVFDKEMETLTLIDYAWQRNAGKLLRTGQK